MQLPLFRKPIYKTLNIVGFILALLLIGLALAGIMPLSYFIVLLILWLGILIWGAFSISSGFYISTINHTNSTKSEIALTFDDGPHGNTEAILKVLEKFQAKATFFVTGTNSENLPDVVKKIKEAGHQIGNHTYSHSGKFPIFSTNDMIEEIAKTSIIIKKLTGTKPTIFRPPFGITNPRIAKATKKINLEVVGWSVRSLDTVIKNPEKIIRRIKRQTKPGSIILMHDYTTHSVFVLEQILKYFSEQNYSFRTIDDLPLNSPNT